MLLDNYISTTELEGSEVFMQTTKELENAFQFKKPNITQDFTTDAFVQLYQISRIFYETHYSEILSDYVPIYISMWKLSLKEMIGIKNMHQDGGISYFAKNGYDARMKTMWTSLYKDAVSGLNESDMGIYVVDCEDPAHQQLYERMAEYNTHFYQLNDHKLCDMRQLGGITIEYDLNSLKRSYFPFKKGTSIQFNSRQLHGSKAIEMKNSSFSKDDLDRFRVALTSVWLHKDDLDEEVVNKPECEDEELYLSACDEREWAYIKEKYKSICNREKLRLRLIRDLIEIHIKHQ
jgi:hypothetical protein